MLIGFFICGKVITIKIIVCIKQVPGTTEIKVDPRTNTLVREGIENIINPFDTYAVEEAVRVKERLVEDGAVDAEVIVITMGPPQSEIILREAISTGADRAVLLSDRAFAGSDTWATASVLAGAVKKIEGCGLVIFGKQTLDGDTGQVGPEFAQVMSIPFIGYVSNIQSITGNRVQVKRLMEDRYEILEARLPLAISVIKDINIPRVPSLRGKMKAKSAEIPAWGHTDIGLAEKDAGLEGSFTRVVKIFTPKISHDVKLITGKAEEQAEEIYAKLRELNVVHGKAGTNGNNS